jgi:flagellar M-ring protein FliF
MEVWNTFRNQIATLWRQWSIQQRIGISAAATACLAAVIGTLIWATQPEYVLIARDLTLNESMDIRGILDTEQIDFRESFSGRDVFVPRGDVSKARIAIRDVIEPTSIVDGGTGLVFPGSPSEEADNRRRSRELRIAKQIEQFDGIRSASVIISSPEPSPFTVEQDPPGASVQVEASGRGRITSGLAQSIVLTVARAVEGLMPENVTLTDSQGNRYSTSDGVGSDIGGQLEFRRQLEMELTFDVESLLNRILGDGKSQVRVKADIDFDEVSRTIKTVDPDSKTKKSETLESVKSEGGKGVPGGPAGYEPNVKIADAASTSSGTFKSESTTTEYDNASTSETIRKHPGQLKRLTVSAVVDLTVPAPANDSVETAVATAPTLTEEQITALIQGAVGFDASRGDVINVVLHALHVPEVAVEPPGLMPMYEEYKPLIEAALVGLGATMAFFIAVLSLRKLRPVIVQDETSGGFSREDYQRMAELSQKARENPELAARILSTWLGQEDTNTPSERETLRQSRAA